MPNFVAGFFNNNVIRNQFRVDVVDANNPSGFVYLMFGSAAAGKLCGEAMHGRFFGGMCVAVQYFPTKTYVARFPSARALQ